MLNSEVAVSKIINLPLLELYSNEITNTIVLVINFLPHPHV